MIDRRSLCSLLQWSALMMLAPAAFAQSSAVRAGTVEVGPFIGGSYGIDHFRVMGGGNITYALKNKWVLPYFEYSYFPGLPHSYSAPLNAGTFNYSIGLHDYHAGVHVRITAFFKEKQFVPYGVFGVGGLHSGAAIGTFTNTASPQIPSTSTPTNFAANTSFAVNGGGGIRYYLGGTGKFGIRAEAKVYKATSSDFHLATFGKVEAGFFFQF